MEHLHLSGLMYFIHQVNINENEKQYKKKTEWKTRKSEKKTQHASKNNNNNSNNTIDDAQIVKYRYTNQYNF